MSCFFLCSKPNEDMQDKCQKNLIKKNPNIM
jgi:hypothetical protein